MLGDIISDLKNSSHQNPSRLPLSTGFFVLDTKCHEKVLLLWLDAEGVSGSTLRLSGSDLTYSASILHSEFLARSSQVTN